MKTVYIENFDFAITKEDILKRLHMPLDHKYGRSVEALLKKVLPLARPRSFYMETPIDEIAGNIVILNGIGFQSKVLAKNLAGKEVAYPFLATSGSELLALAGEMDAMDQFTLDAIMEALLRKASLALNEALANIIDSNNKLVAVNPGSLVDWPITEQQKLFELFGDESKKLGVSLTQTSLMNPIKSISGILYEDEDEFHNCQLCQRRDCPTRQTPFDAALFEELMEQ